MQAADGIKSQDWRFPSRTECLTCHSRAANFVLGISGQQLNRAQENEQDQIESLAAMELFAAALPAGERPKLVDSRDTTADLEARARSYLQVNCAICHVAAGGGNSRMELGLATPREKMELIEARPQHDTFGIANAMLVAPGDPDRSVLVQRLSRRGPGQMPPLVSHRTDKDAIFLMRQWITGLKPSRPFVREWRAEDLKDQLAELNVAGPHETGAKAFREIGCAQCHKIGDDGGSVGPNLSDVGKRLKPHELLKAIVDPSAQIADTYATWLVQTADGQVHQGRIEHEDADRLILRAASAVDLPTTIAVADIEARRRAPTSNMPAGTVNVLQREEILDLLAYLLGQRGLEPAAASDSQPEKSAASIAD
jgi:putative heme-binding domain-containing protein